jgi:hypothetical protein
MVVLDIAGTGVLFFGSGLGGVSGSVNVRRAAATAGNTLRIIAYPRYFSVIDVTSRKIPDRTLNPSAIYNGIACNPGIVTVAQIPAPAAANTHREYRNHRIDICYMSEI